MNSVLGTIFQIQRWSINDGEGIRSTVFLKSCPLRCRWCANPESWNPLPEILFLREKCIGCGRCSQVCAAAAMEGKRQAVSLPVREKCVACGKCCEVCPAGARKKMGEQVTVDEVMQVIKRDAIFYQESGGGVTFSGGEPLAQPAFLRQLVLACRRLGIDTAVETAGYYDWEPVQDIFANVDFVFFDCKHMNHDVHKKMTGAGNAKILDNLVKISGVQPTVVRVPLMEEVNASEHNIRALCKFLREYTRVEGIELLPYHDFGEAKYRAVGATCPAFSAPGEAKLERIKKIIVDHGITVWEFK
ncbi:glycyl-radical enzyme activating protein [Sporomusa acidovorans]|uniref:4-hydroxyphenylacetate decarboxylase activating enzyme n=1 Tax=Sporomusa acidovorans (strain ATCC 49682 / DSM 3132 / Mol) TaxID=1123286 RepID=A0ABZ3IXB7_SPOA4|nr:glycyl-radical enzyme activating protein [Sporomusa acidovorans]OZC15852.1 4-hydroxyphenylacetate decarboxylase activating enzyme [Sporomusa acidovorans DSM 3132]SDF29357.1 pyruvate formate lyase activating enzyme [Sporomusa acidovorans]